MSLQILETARSALAAMQVAMEVASQNVANANTPGYIRQRVQLTPLPLYHAFSSGFNVVGGGVTAAQIQRLRNQCLEAQIQHQTGQLGWQQAWAETLQRIQALFPDLEENGVAASLGAFFDSLQSLQTDPTSQARRQNVLTYAQAFCQQMRHTYSQILGERALLEEQLKQQVQQVNRLLHTVAEINGRIMAMGDQPGGNDLCVQREEAIRQVAELCGALGLDQPHGVQDVLLGGVRLVQETKVTELTLVVDPANPARHEVAVGAVQNPEGLGGRIGAWMDIRDKGVDKWLLALNELAGKFAEAFNAQHRAGYDYWGNPGADFFSYDPTKPAATIQIAEELQQDVKRLAAAGAPEAAPGDGANAMQLAKVRRARLFAAGTQTTEDFYAQLLYEVGASAQQAQEAQQARETLLTSLKAEYAQQAGVSLDEEATDIMRFQQVYNAALRLVKIADEMLAQLMALVD